MKKLAPQEILILTICACVIFLAYSFFYKFLPNQSQIQMYQAYKEKLEFESMKMSRARKRVQIAKGIVEDITRKWQEIVIRKTPSQMVENGGIDLSVNRWQLTVDAKKYRDHLQKKLNRQMKVGGVYVINGPELPMPPIAATEIVENYFNYPAIAFPVALFNLSPISVEGTIEQIIRHINAWNTIPNCMVVTHGLSLKGTSPHLIATYQMSIISYIRGNKIGAFVPEDTQLGSFDSTKSGVKK